MVKDKKDIRPFLVQFGVALAISFAGFLYSRLKTRTKSSHRPRSPRSSDHSSEADVVGERAWHRDDFHITNKTPSSGGITSISAERYEDSYVLKVAVDNSMVVSPSIRQSGDKDGHLLPEFNDLVKEFDFPATNAGISSKKDVETPRSDMEFPRAFQNVENDDHEQEIRHLKNMVRMLREREKNLEVQLLEFYGLKEQKAAMMELQNRLKINNMEAKLFGLKIESLQADNRRLQEQVADHAKTVAELDAAKAKIKLLKKKPRSEAEQKKEHILSLQKRVSLLQEQELKAAAIDSDIKFKLHRLKDLEAEAEELRESNSRFQLENSELAYKLESTQSLANSVLEDPETEALKELGNRLRQENEDLAKEVERLQADRCSDVEELVYLRWINACLRYELRNFQPPHGKTVARDLSKCLSPRSEQKAKQLILEYANTEGIGEKGIMDFEFEHWSSSQASHLTDSRDLDDSSFSSKTNNSNKIKIFNKLMRLIRGNDIHHRNHGSSSYKTGGTDDSDSLNARSSISTVTDAASDLQYNRVRTPSLNSSRHLYRHSLDNHAMRSLRIDDMKDIESGQRHSEVGASHGYTRFSLGRESASDLSAENLLDHELHSREKSKLVKFAEALKDSGSRTGNGRRTGKVHRKSVSLGSFEALRQNSLTS